MFEAKRKWNGFVFVFIFVALMGIQANAASDRAVSAEASIQFVKEKIKVGPHTITVEIADTDPKRERGLMFREKLPENQGMLFVFDNERPLSFWMKNTLIPLSIGFFDKDRKLLDVHEMTPMVMGEKDFKVYSSRAPAMYALEMPQGWFTKHAVKPGATFTFVRKP